MTVSQQRNGRYRMDTNDPQYATDVAYVIETQCTAQKFQPAMKLTEAKALVLAGAVQATQDGYTIAGSKQQDDSSTNQLLQHKNAPSGSQ